MHLRRVKLAYVAFDNSFVCFILSLGLQDFDQLLLFFVELVDLVQKGFLVLGVWSAKRALIPTVLGFPLELIIWLILLNKNGSQWHSEVRVLCTCWLV